MTDITYKKKMSLTGVAAQIVTIGLLFVFWRLGQKWVVIPAALVLVFLFFFLPKVINALEVKFHKKALFLLATGKAHEVPAFARKQLLLSLFGASAPIDAKLGLAYSQIGEYEGALDCLQAAIPFAPRAELPALQVAYIKSLFVTGDPARAQAEAKHMLDGGGARLPEVLVMMARSAMALGKNGPPTAKLLDEATQVSTGGDVALMICLTQIELQLIYGRKPDELAADADSTQRFIRVWIQLVRGKIRESKHVDKALSAYAKAVKEGREDRCWFAELARGRIEELSKRRDDSGQNVDALLNGHTSQDEVIRRKKKRRR